MLDYWYTGRTMDIQAVYHEFQVQMPWISMLHNMDIRHKLSELQSMLMNIHAYKKHGF